MALCPSPSVLPEETAAGGLVTLWACWGAGKGAGLVGRFGRQDRSIMDLVWTLAFTLTEMKSHSRVLSREIIQ